MNKEVIRKLKYEWIEKNQETINNTKNTGEIDTTP